MLFNVEESQPQSLFELDLRQPAFIRIIMNATE
jgi:hypothetical protein